jgi:group I intron endonuclease
MGYIYKITNKVNNKVYIGQTIRTVEERYQRHLYEAKCHTNRPLYDSMNHHGIDNFGVETLVEAPDDQLNELEVFYIAKYKTTDPTFGYNLTTGGDSFKSCLPPETEARRVAKIAAAHRGRKQSKEAVEKRVAKLRGRKHSEESRRNMSEGQKKRDPATFARGYTVPQERRDKISKALTGQVQSEETKLKRKESMSKLKWWNNGTDCVRAEVCPEGYVAGRINFEPSAASKAKSSQKGTKWFTNGKENRMAYECPEGFWPGKTFKKDLVNKK